MGMASPTQRKALARARSRANNAMLMRLRTMHVNATGKGQEPTVAQISAAYATMVQAPNVYDAQCWQLLLQLAQRAIGVLDTCFDCNGTGMRSIKARARCTSCNALYGCGCGVEYKAPKGFERVTCAKYEEGQRVGETCRGSGQIRVHVPRAGDLPGTMLNQPQAKELLMQQLTQVLNAL